LNHPSESQPSVAGATSPSEQRSTIIESPQADGSGAESFQIVPNDPATPPRARRRPAPRRSPEGPRRPSRSAFAWFAGFLAPLGAPLQIVTLGLFGAGLFVSLHAPELPSVESLRQVQFETPLRVFSSDGA
jgi:hypothetical protein